MTTLFSKTIDFDQPFQRLTRGILAPPEGMVPNSSPPPEGMVPNSSPPPKEWCIEFWPPPEGMVPNFEPKNDLKKGQICVFGSFLGPNGPFRLFSHHILCSTGPMKEKEIFCDTLPLIEDLLIY